MATNDFLPFAAAGGANVLSQADWQALAARLAGYTAGVANSAQINKGLRQSAAMAAMIGQFINTYGGLDALDNGDIATLLEHFAAAFRAQAPNYVATVAGTANAVSITLVDPAPTANSDLGPATLLRFQTIATENSGAVTIAANGLPALPLLNARGNPLQRGDLPASTFVEVLATGTSYVLLGVTYSQTRRRLTQNLTLYINSGTGNDSNTGGASDPFLTLQGAVNWAQSNLDLNGYILTFSTTGNFSAGVIVNGPLVGQGNVPQVVFDLGGSNVSASNSSCFFAGIGAMFSVRNGGQLNATGTGAGQGSCLVAQGGTIYFQNIICAFTSRAHLSASAGGTIYCTGNYSVTGNASQHLAAFAFGQISLNGFTCAVSGPPAFTQFAYTFQGQISTSGSAITGTATGQRYYVDGYGTIFTNGSGANYFPGNAAGAVNQGNYL